MIESQQDGKTEIEKKVKEKRNTNPVPSLSQIDSPEYSSLPSDSEKQRRGSTEKQKTKKGGSEAIREALCLPRPC